MAQIQIEERRRGLGWLWAILAIIVLALVVWYFATNDATDETPTTTTPASGTTIDAPAPITPAAAA